MSVFYAVHSRYSTVDPDNVDINSYEMLVWADSDYTHIITRRDINGLIYETKPSGPDLEDAIHNLKGNNYIVLENFSPLPLRAYCPSCERYFPYLSHGYLCDDCFEK